MDVQAFPSFGDSLFSLVWKPFAGADNGHDDDDEDGSQGVVLSRPGRAMCVLS